MFLDSLIFDLVVVLLEIEIFALSSLKNLIFNSLSHRLPANTIIFLYHEQVHISSDYRLYLLFLSNL